MLSRDGRTLKSSTFNIVGEDYHFALGINLDITNMVRAGQMLSELTATSGDLQQTLMQDASSKSCCASASAPWAKSRRR